MSDNSDNKEQAPPQKLPDIEEAKLTKVSKLSFTWVLPLIAVIIAAALVIEHIPDKEAEIEILLADGSGINAHSTLIKYQGIKVGVVEEVALSQNLKQVLVKAVLDEQAIPLASEGAKFWVVRPALSISGIEGLDTIVSGPYIQLQPGEGPRQSRFVALTRPPLGSADRPGLKVVLIAERAGSLKTGTPVFYRDVQVGKVYEYELQENSQRVMLSVHIEEAYRDLVRDNSVFWSSGGFNLDVGIFGAEITTESLKGILTGGISLATPDEPGARIVDGKRFDLKEEQKKEWLKWAPALKVKSELVDHADGKPVTQESIIEAEVKD